MIVTVLLYLCFKDRIKFPIFIEVLCIAIVVWFGIALWYTPEHYQGWPVDRYPPAMSYVKDYIVVEPTQDGNPGSMYVWTISYRDQEGKRIYDPKDLLKPDIKPGVPRVYKIPYNKKQHKKLQRHRKGAKKGKKGEKGNEEGILFYEGKKRGFKVIDFQKILKKETEQ